MTSWDYERMMNSITRGVPAGLQTSADGVARISYGGKNIGTIAMTEVSTISMADIAGIAVRSAVPAVIGIIATDLAIKGISACLNGQGWCKDGQANPRQGDTNFNGGVWCQSGGVGYDNANPICGDSLDAVCAALYANAGGGWVFDYSSIGTVSGTWLSGRCYGHTRDGSLSTNNYTGAQQQTNPTPCVSGFIWDGNKCVVDKSKPVPQVPMTYPDVAAAWNASLSQNPQRIEDYWKVASPQEQADAQKKAVPSPARINGSPTVSDPAVQTGTQTNTKPDGTTETCTTSTSASVTARPNTGATMSQSPLNYSTQTSRTVDCPSTGPRTNTNNTDTGDSTSTNTGPASAPQPNCGLGTAGSPPCKIDETGTATYQEPSVAKTKMDDADSKLKTQLDSIGQGKPDQFGIGDVVKPLQGSCSSFSYALPKATGIESMDVDICPTIDATRDVVTWFWVIVSALTCILLVRDAINGA